VLERRREAGRLLLLNGASEDFRPRPDVGGLMVWAPVTSEAATTVAYHHPAAERGIASGIVASPMGLLEQLQGPLRSLRLLQARTPSACCQSPLLIELAADEAVFRAVIHQPVPRAMPELLQLRGAYPPVPAGDRSAYEWNSRSLDPVEALGLLVLGGGLDGKPGPSVYLLWGVEDGAPRAWEAFSELPEPRLLRAAFGEHFRYVDRDEELLVVDRSPSEPLGRRPPLTEEHVYTTPFARPALPDAAHH
jgi:hypothetical protein